MIILTQLSAILYYSEYVRFLDFDPFHFHSSFSKWLSFKIQLSEHDCILYYFTSFGKDSDSCLVKHMVLLYPTVRVTSFYISVLCSFKFNKKIRKSCQIQFLTFHIVICIFLMKGIEMLILVVLSRNWFFFLV